MTIDTLIMLAGAFVALLSFLGFPNSWDTVLFFIAGICIIGLGIVVRRKEGERLTMERKIKESKESAAGAQERAFERDAQ